jgi:hypothetical protein
MKTTNEWGIGFDLPGSDGKPRKPWFAQPPRQQLPPPTPSRRWLKGTVAVAFVVSAAILAVVLVRSRSNATLQAGEEQHPEVKAPANIILVSPAVKKQETGKEVKAIKADTSAPKKDAEVAPAPKSELIPAPKKEVEKNVQPAPVGEQPAPLPIVPDAPPIVMVPVVPVVIPVILAEIKLQPGSKVVKVMDRLIDVQLGPNPRAIVRLALTEKSKQFFALDKGKLVVCQPGGNPPSTFLLGSSSTIRVVHGASRRMGIGEFDNIPTGVTVFVSLP